MSSTAPTVQRRPIGRRWTGLPLTVGVLVVMLVAVTLRQGHEEFAGATLLTFTLLSWVPLLLRLRIPIATLAATVVIESLHLIFLPLIEPDLTAPVAVAAYQPVPLATMAAAWTVASRCPRVVGVIAGFGSAAVLLLVSLVAQPSSLIGTDMVMFNLVCIATGVGLAVAIRRDRALRLKQDRAQHIREQVTDERLRIARELHDVLAHHLTLVNAQAGIAGYLLKTDPGAAETALLGIADHTRSALDELRATVGLLRQDDHADEDARAPQPSLDQLDSLVGGFRSAGAVVAIDVRGEPIPLTPAADLAAYRIIQEGLTNAMKHAPGSSVDLAIAWTTVGLQIGIENGPGTERPGRPARSGSGAGLIGMRERLKVCGGSLESGPTENGGYRITVDIPADERSTRRDSA